jgi:raffinose/stachyose/melibiose transport system permease protein
VTGRRRSRAILSPGESRLTGYLYVLPALALYGAFVLWPLLHAAWLSLFSWDGVTPASWVGLNNYHDILTDPSTRSAFRHSVELIAFYAALPVAIGLLLAGAIARTRIRWLPLFRTVLFLPQVIAGVAVGVVWTLIYAPDGSLNALLRLIGLGSLTQTWLGDFTLALPSVGLIGTWVGFGFCLVLFLSGVQKIPTDLFDAARVDGAGPVAEFFAVTLPGLRNEIAVALTITTVGALRSFDLIYVTTRGGPGDSTLVPGILIYRRAFEYGQVGGAAALGIALAVVIFTVTFLITRLEQREET